MSLGPCNLWVMNVLKVKKWISRRCLCFHTHTHTLFILLYWCVLWCVQGQSVDHTKSTKYIQLVELQWLHFSFTIFQHIRLRTALLRIIIQRVVVVSYRCFRTTFLSFRYAQMVVCCLSLAHRLDSFFQGVFLATLTTTLPSIQPLATTLLADTTETFDLPHACLYKLRTGARGFALDSWMLRMGPIGCPEMSVRNTTIRQEEHGIQLLRSRIMKLAYKAISYKWM